MIKRILLPLLAVLWLASPANAQSPTKLCFPTGTTSGGRVSCQDVSASNPLPITGVNVSIGSLSISALNAVSVTVTNTVGVPVFVSNPNGFGGNGTVQQGTNPWIISTPNTINANIVNVPISVTTPNGFGSGGGSGGSVTQGTTPWIVSSPNIVSVLDSQVLAAVQSSIPAGTNSIGFVTPSNTGGASFTQSMTPTIQASAYSAGNCLGGFNALTLANSNGQTGFVTNFRVTSIAGNTGSVNVYLFDSQPTTSTCTDKSTFSLSSADTDKMIAAIQNGTLATVTGATTPTNISNDFNPPRPFIAGGSTASGVRTIFYALQAATALTPASVTDIHVRGGAALN